MNLINEEICALRSAIEHIDYMLAQPQYKEIEPILRARKQDFLDELKIKLE